MHQLLTCTGIALATAAVLACADQPSLTEPATGSAAALTAASARAPTRNSFVEPFEFQVDCGAYDVVSAGELTATETTFYDRSGVPVRVQAHVAYRATIANATTGKVLADNSSYNFRLDLVTGVAEVNGVVYNVRDLESGYRIKDIGRLVFDAEGVITFEAGRHDVGGFGDASPLYCEALA